MSIQAEFRAATVWEKHEPPSSTSLGAVEGAGGCWGVDRALGRKSPTADSSPLRSSGIVEQTTCCPEVPRA